MRIRDTACPADSTGGHARPPVRRLALTPTHAERRKISSQPRKKTKIARRIFLKPAFKHSTDTCIERLFHLQGIVMKALKDRASSRTLGATRTKLAVDRRSLGSPLISAQLQLRSPSRRSQTPMLKTLVAIVFAAAALSACVVYPARPAYISGCGCANVGQPTEIALAFVVRA